MKKTELGNNLLLLWQWRGYVVEIESHIAPAGVLQQHYPVSGPRDDCVIVRAYPAALKTDWFRQANNGVVPITFEFLEIVGQPGVELFLMAFAKEDAPIFMSL